MAARRVGYRIVIAVEVVLIIGLAAAVCWMLPSVIYQSQMSFHPTERYDEKLQTLAENLAKWQDRHISHYRMTLDLPYSSTYDERMPLIVEVQDGKMVSVVDGLGKRITPDSNDDLLSYSPETFTIEGLFSYLRQTMSANPVSMTVEYDLALGYPSWVEIDPWREPCCQWEYITVRDLQVLSP